MPAGLFPLHDAVADAEGVEVVAGAVQQRLRLRHAQAWKKALTQDCIQAVAAGADEAVSQDRFQTRTAYVRLTTFTVDRSVNSIMPHPRCSPVKKVVCRHVKISIGLPLTSKRAAVGT